MARYRHVWLFLLIAAAACGDEPPPPEPVTRPVRSIIVQPASDPVSRTFTGVARAGTEATLSFRVPGTVSSVPVRVGSRVRVGQTIAVLDPADYELQVKEAEAGLRQAEAQASNASADLRRVRGLYEEGSASLDAYDATRAAAASAQAQFEALSQRLELARRQVGYTRLVAPADGAIAEIHVDTNENVAAGQAVAVLTASGRREVELGVPENVITRVAPGQAVSVTFDALPGSALAATVTAVGVTSSGLATTFPVQVTLSTAVPGVLPGMAASVRFDFPNPEQTPRFVVPSTAIGEDPHGRFAFTVHEQPGGALVARRRAVTIGQLGGDGLEVMAGLSAGDRLITAGTAYLTDGMMVRLIEGAGR